MMRSVAALCLAIALSACGAPPSGPEAARRVPTATDLLPLPPMKTFGAPRVNAPMASNTAITRDFLELAFQMESGRRLPILTRFEGPITLRVTGTVPAVARADVARLIGRLRNEAGIDVTQVPSDRAASITVEFLPRKRMQALVPQAACFVVPRLTSWDEYRRSRRGPAVDWTTLETRTRAAVFVPSDTPPQEIRDCLHEEIAQALGPLNDLYRLPDSVFNDDNFHNVLTGFDMLILRAYYAPELSSGMSMEEVAMRLPGILSRINPRGGRAGYAPPEPTPHAFVEAIETALGPHAGASRRKSAALKAVAIAEAEGWHDARAGFAWFALGRLSLGSRLDTALEAFLKARRIYGSGSGMEVQAAHVDMQLAAFALSAGHAEEAEAITLRALPAVADAENAALLATLMLIRAEALEAQGRASEARAVRLDALGWARYGFGGEADIRRRVSEIAALSPANRTRVP